MPTDTTIASDARSFAAVLGRSKFTIVLTLMVAILVASAVTFLPKPVYRASAKLVVGQGGALLQGSQSGGSAADTITHTMADLVTSDVVARRTIERGGLIMSPGRLRAHLAVSLKPSSTVLTISYEDEQEATGLRVLEALTAAFSSLVSERFGQRADMIGPVPSTARDSTQSSQVPLTVTVFDPAHREGRVSPTPTRNMAAAVAAGLGLGILIALLRDAPPGRRPRRASSF